MSHGAPRNCCGYQTRRRFSLTAARMLMRATESWYSNWGRRDFRASTLRKRHSVTWCDAFRRATREAPARRLCAGPQESGFQHVGDRVDARLTRHHCHGRGALQLKLRWHHVPGARLRTRRSHGQNSHANERKGSEGALAMTDGFFNADSRAASVWPAIAVSTVFVNGAATGRPTVW